MKENFTSINVVLDRSGSMKELANDTIGSFNALLKDQKELPYEAVFTLCTFNTDYHLVHDSVPLKDIPDLDDKSYRCSGGTSLLDAVGATITSVGNKLARMPESDRPSKVIFLIITDGEENSSHEFTKEQVSSMVQHQRDHYKWEFVFMGANIDAFKNGTSLGVDSRNTMNYSATSVGTKGLYGQVSTSLRSYRGGNSGPQVDFFNQPEENKTDSKDLNVVPSKNPQDQNNN